MKAEFWQNKWKENQIGFHQAEFNPSLVKFWDDFTLGMNEGVVLVPLCGKSKDMLFLAEKGLKVIGIELSELAVEDFYQENKIKFDKVGSLYKSDRIDIYCGDLFEITAKELGRVDYIFDRASIIALPIEMRQRYAKWLRSEAPRASMFVQTLEFDSNDGPPFSVDEEQLNLFYADSCDITRIQTKEIEQAVHTENQLTIKNHTFFVRPK